jgi:hypothetical protein
MPFYELTFNYDALRETEDFGFNHCVIEAKDIVEAVDILSDPKKMKNKNYHTSALKQIKEVFYIYPKKSN